MRRWETRGRAADETWVMVRQGRGRGGEGGGQDNKVAREKRRNEGTGR